MRMLSFVLGALVLAFCLCAPAQAQTVSGETPVVGIDATTVMTKEARVADDPQVHAAYVAIRQANRRYDHMVWSVTCSTLNVPYVFSNEPGFAPIMEGLQEVEWRTAIHQGQWFSTHPLTNGEVLGYIAYLSQRLHLNGWQEDQLGWYEAHYIGDLAPLYTAYRNAVNSALARLNEYQVVTVNVDRATISTIPPDLETTVPAESR